jgi:hypothetical protein
MLSPSSLGAPMPTTDETMSSDVIGDFHEP